MSLGTFYCHGLPGWPGEIELAGHRPKGWACADLLGCDPGDPIGDLLNRFDAQCATSGLMRVTGFSLGAMAALHLAARRPDMVTDLHLIAPAAPLTLGQFLPDMAGAQVFRVARSSAARLRFLLSMQAAATRVAPGIVLRAMISTAQPAERALFRNDPARRIVTRGLRQALTQRAAYAAWLRLYVSDWRPILRDVQCRIEIRQGTEDAWVPPAMAHALLDALPNAGLTEMPGLGHYGALQAHLADAE
ncbi:alpha/beta fold hydrolase [Jannaschia donghaensis]|uniref:Acetoin dehydrogenase E2 subunit dihydrolipoyllysine-residue acetyltransferase n=1 Tax=Jannaschia donghaensis TaxID=420998 RepID=A0A0M6YKA2_9RHOB|nr:alpha/beta hydrolase [Jannaschia donghaensis]CTQ50791.1 acetoin dehydrogenase E2 subunit dihydrolipoyllysine-residue acetyltransferase [Jannaschia donghaensis]